MLIVALVFLLSTLATVAHAQETIPPGASAAESPWDDPEPGATLAEEPGGHGRFQLRRENVERGTSEETTRTYVRSDNFLWGGMLSLQVAFPDAKTDFAGDPFDPRLGDSKVRFRGAPFSRGRFDLSYFVEATFPTADPAELGTGKYQLSLGATGSTAIAAPAALRASHELRLTSQLQQINSVAGDPQRADINYTKLDLSLRDTWKRGWVKIACNMRADWEQNGKTGAVGELEYGRRVDRDWSVWIVGGGLLWGEGVKGTYGSKIMLGLDRWF